MTALSPDLTRVPPSASASSPLVNLLFIHHSVGGQLLATQGDAENTPLARRSLHRSHPNGGGLRDLLVANGYRVHEASYGSLIGQDTDLFDWLPKFSQQMRRIIATRFQDELLVEGSNQVVVFKSCYPNNAFKEEASPGARALTLAAAKQSLLAVRDEFQKWPQTLFVMLTTPPLLATYAREPAWKKLAKFVLRRRSLRQVQTAAARDAREFARWLTSHDGWLKGYPQKNVAIFDYYDLLTANGASNFLEYPSGDGTDNHPNAQAQALAASRLVRFLDRSVREAGVANAR